MGWDSGRDGGKGGVPDPDLPELRDPRLAGFAADGEWDACPPSAALAAALEAASGPTGMVTCPTAGPGRGAFPSDTRMDQFRAAACLDLLNGITAQARIASGQCPTRGKPAGPEPTGTKGTTVDPDDGPLPPAARTPRPLSTTRRNSRGPG